MHSGSNKPVKIHHRKRREGEGKETIPRKTEKNKTIPKFGCVNRERIKPAGWIIAMCKTD